jgi:hypothetical protein
MTEVIATTEIPREKGFIYFIGTDEKGNLTICKTKAGRKTRRYWSNILLWYI